MRAFSRDALEQYVPVIQEEVRAAVRDWLQRDPCVLVYPEMKRLMFRIAMRILLGFDPEQIRTDEQQLVEAFEEMIKNLFSLPIDVPFSGLYRVCGSVRLQVDKLINVYDTGLKSIKWIISHLHSFFGNLLRIYRISYNSVGRPNNSMMSM